MLPSEAPTPPWAATVCERVGNTFESTATLRPARASCSEARMPEPPAPTMTTSNLRLVIWSLVYAVIKSSEPPEHLNGPTRATDKPDDGENLAHQADDGRLDVVHPDVAHADPDVIEQRGYDDEG